MKRKQSDASVMGLHDVSFLVLDEADRLLDMGFTPQVHEVVSHVCKARQTLMFSATWPEAVQRLAQGLLRDRRVLLMLNQGGNKPGAPVGNAKVTQLVEVVPQADKYKRLLAVLRGHDQRFDRLRRVIIFANTKRTCADLAEKLVKDGVSVAALHGNLSQEHRSEAMRGFVAGEFMCLVATDLAARGLDVEDISLVVCYDFPDSMMAGAEEYVHRIGRTGRAGRRGLALTFFPAPEDSSATRSAGNAHALVELLRAAKQEVPQSLLALDTGQTQLSARQKRRKLDTSCKQWQAKSSPTLIDTDDSPANAVHKEGAGAASASVWHRFGETPFDAGVRRELQKSYKIPTLVQAHGWPLYVGGCDAVTIAETGSGKTLAYLLPALHYIQAKQNSSSWRTPSVLVLVPTRELAKQIGVEASRFATLTRAQVLCLFGGEDCDAQAAAWDNGSDLVVATPGRLLYLLARGGGSGAEAATTIASLGRMKQLEKAEEAFRAFMETAGPGARQARRVHSALLGAYVSAGEMGKAHKFAGEMRKAGVQLGVIEYTMLMKGDA